MAMRLSAAIGGFAGACALTLINEAIRKFDPRAPRLDLLGRNAVAKLIKGPASAPLLVQKLLPLAITGDLISNTLYFSLASGKNRNKTLMRGALLGLGAGLGAVVLPKPMGLDSSTTNRAGRTQAMTIMYYVIGGLVAAAAINALERNTERFPIARPIKTGAAKTTSLVL
jgi:hypothetical protein